jgi:hypothetical protein
MWAKLTAIDDLTTFLAHIDGGEII